MNDTLGQSAYTRTIKSLVSRISDTTSGQQSFYEQAANWFFGHKARIQQDIEYQQQLFLLERRKEQCAQRDLGLVERQLAQEQQHYADWQHTQQQMGIKHYLKLQQLCYDILAVCQGERPEDTLQLSAKLLGTIQLMSPTQGKNIAVNNQKVKHLYKAVLCLRLLDKLIEDENLQHSYIRQRWQQSQTADRQAGYDAFRDDVQVPLLMAALLQDIGSLAPEAQRILKGADGTADEFRVLEQDERVELLQISFAQSVEFLQKALAIAPYPGRDLLEQQRHMQREREKLNLALFLLKNAVKPEHGIGNVLKIPQIYTSVVLSTKANYQYEDLPKAALVLEKGAEKGLYSPVAVRALLTITGTFPQGFGIVYIPKDAEQRDLDRYEYAIVSGLYPPDTKVALCRMVTRNLTFNISSQACTISVDNNMFFPSARKKLSVISEQRLSEILSKLVSNFEERKSMSLLPKYWHPDDYFQYVKNQNLWIKVVMLEN
ncbi:hypothetical protein [Arsukibacterium sp.]|uniref:hypothetical protein n=1 Tax=Arsukibacterium sp. TaxID=1977258 RepID=UPI002FD9313C